MRGLALFALSLLAVAAQLGSDRIGNSAAEPHNWLTYSGGYDSHRYSTLTQINRDNVGSLRPAWVYQTQATGEFKCTPLVVDGRMYITEPGKVVALDPRSGRVLWTYEHPTPTDLPVWWGNRGVAVHDEMVFYGSVDAQLIALDARTGTVRWRRQVDDYRAGYAVSAAPLIVKNKVIVGIAGGETGVRGFLDAYDIETGDRAWRFWTIPAPGEPGSETWSGDSWRRGGGPTWLTGSYDPELDLIYWGVGNPAPPLNGDERPGDNLFTDSLVALHADSGELEWYFQFTPHDVWDWDSAQIPVLLDAPFEGVERKLVLFANRNGFYYALDRETGEFLLGRPYVEQTWAAGLDERGRPLVLPAAIPTEDWVPVRPSMEGATNWQSPSYSRRTGLLYVPAREIGGLVKKREESYTPGRAFWGGTSVYDDSELPYGAIRALRYETGEIAWELTLYSPTRSGILTTASDLVFGGSVEGNFFALDARDGTPLWEFQTGGGISANPITYSVRGTQYVMTAGGQGLFAFALPEPGGLP